MLTEPVGPRSPDEILSVVYQRTERARRRRRQQLGAVAAALAFGVAGLVSLGSGDDEASRVRAVDRAEVRSEKSADTSTSPTTATPAAGGEAAQPAPASSRPRQQSKDGGQGVGSGAQAGKATATTVPPLPTATTLPPVNGPDVRTMAQATDAEGDAVLPGWYYDVVSGSMKLDLRNNDVVFTTQYATPQGSADRDDRTLRSEFKYENDYVNIDVTETANALGPVTLGDESCDECTRALDVAAGVLTVTVPVETMNAYLVKHYGSGASIEKASVSVLHLMTFAAGIDVPADETEGAQ